MRKILAPPDLLSLCFLALLSVLAVLSGAALSSAGLLPLYGLLAASVCTAAGYRKRSVNGNKGHYLSTAVAVVTVVLVFNSLGELIPRLQQHRFDEALISIDHALFGVHPTVWMERWVSPFLTTVLMVGYISYYFIPLAVGVSLIAHNKRNEFDRALFGILLCFYLSYVGYLLAPAVGPRFTLDHLQTTNLQAGPFIAALQELLNRLEQNKTDAFPSGHTAIALVSLYYAWKGREQVLFLTLVPVVAALLFSTVYLRYHYVIDVMAGVALAGLSVAAAPFLERPLSGAAGREGDQRHGAA